MRRYLIPAMFILLALLPTTALAHDFKVDGIYYLKNGTEATVTYRGAAFDSYSNEYSGDVTIPSTVTYNGTTYSVTEIGKRAFYGCSGLTSITIPNSVTSIGEGAFMGCNGLTNTIIPNSVTTIGNSAFWGCSGLYSITIPNSVTSIGNSTFDGCSGLTSITIPNSVTEIGKRAFYGCSGLTSITIPNSVTAIGLWAFSDCSGLTCVNIGNSVTTIGEYAFSGCNRLTSIAVDSDNPEYDSRDNCNALIETASNRLILGCKSTVIPNSVTTIGQSAFAGCSGLTSVNIPNSVTTIGQSAFTNCSGLTSMTVESGNTNYDSRNNCNGIIETATSTLIVGCMSSSIPNSIATIGSSAFAGCSGLTSVNIPNSVTSIGESAFSGCTGLTSVTIPNSVTAIGNSVFEGCSGLTSVTIPNSVTTIGDYAFEGCTGLTSVTIPNSVTYIGCFVFAGCSELTDVTCLATTPPYIFAPDPGVYAFPYNVTNQATLYVPFTSVATYQEAFNWGNFSHIVGLMTGIDFEVDGIYYRALTENTAMVISRPDEDDNYSGDVVIPEDVTYQDVTFTVTSIDVGAFEDCFELNSVVIGDAVESIGENAFQGCTDLTSVTIGSGVTNIGAKAFNYCNALQTVTCRGTVPPVMASINCFTNAAYSRAILKVPRPEIETYAAADYWYKFAHIEGWGYLGPGDVNGSGTIDMDDLTRLINIMLTDDLGGIDPAWADVTGNGIVSMNDLTELINLLLNQ